MPKNYISKLKVALIMNYKLVCKLLDNFDNFRATDTIVRSISGATPTDLYNNQLASNPPPLMLLLPTEESKPCSDL